MTPWTLVRFLVGERSAILEVVEDSRSLWIGLAFVGSAGLAREYDREDLLAEPWHLAIPLFASLLASFVIFVSLWGNLQLSRSPVGFWGLYRKFLSLFWMTAPLAWLYAIPYEQFLPPMDALRANLWTLGLVALWRVALMIRVVDVWLGDVWRAAIAIVFWADALAMAAVMFLPWPIIEVMGGMTPPEDRMILGRAKMTVLFFGAPLGVVTLISAFFLSPPAPLKEQPPPRERRPLWSLAGLAGLAIVLGFAVLPWTQPPQQNRRLVEQAMNQGNVHEALTLLSEIPRESFPPDWIVPPLWEYNDNSRDLFLKAYEASESGEGPTWVHDIYKSRFSNFIRSPEFVLNANDKQFLRIARAIDRMPESVAGAPIIAVESLIQRAWIAPAEVQAMIEKHYPMPPSPYRKAETTRSFDTEKSAAN